jgi:ABC-type Fe3+-hydroxamate transport system substrate-binding protein
MTHLDTSDFQDLPGSAIKLGKTGLVCPALNFKALKSLKPQLTVIQSGWALDANDEKAEQYIAAVVTVVHAALKRNYPHITAESIEEFVDLHNVSEVTMAVMGISGFNRDAADQPGSDAGESTGTN